MAEAPSSQFSLPIEQRQMAHLTQFQKAIADKETAMEEPIVKASKNCHICIAAMAVVGLMALAAGAYLIATTGPSQMDYFASGIGIASVGTIAAIVIIALLVVRKNKFVEKLQKEVTEVRELKIEPKDLLQALEKELTPAENAVLSAEALEEVYNKVAQTFKILASIEVEEGKESPYRTFFKHLQEVYFGEASGETLTQPQQGVLLALTRAFETLDRLAVEDISSPMANYLLGAFTTEKFELFTKNEQLALMLLFKANAEEDRASAIARHPQALAHFSISYNAPSILLPEEGKSPLISSDEFRECFDEMTSPLTQAKLLESLRKARAVIAAGEHPLKAKALQAIDENIYYCFSALFSTCNDEILIKELEQHPEARKRYFWEQEQAKARNMMAQLKADAKDHPEKFKERMAKVFEVLHAAKLDPNANYAECFKCLEIQALKEVLQEGDVAYNFNFFISTNVKMKKEYMYSIGLDVLEGLDGIDQILAKIDQGVTGNYNFVEMFKLLISEATQKDPSPSRRALMQAFLQAKEAKESYFGFKWKFGLEKEPGYQVFETKATGQVQA